MAEAPRLPGALLEIFLTRGERDAFAEWREDPCKSSLASHALAPALDWLAEQVPESLSPSTLSLAGIFAVAEAWYFGQAYGESAPVMTSCVCAASLAAFGTLREVAQRHGRRALLDTPVVELFCHVCDLAASVFLTAVLSSLLAGAGTHTQWCCVQAVQLGLVWAHYGSFVCSDRPFDTLPGELTLSLATLLFLLGMCGLLPVHALAALAFSPHMIIPTVFCFVFIHAFLSSPETHPRTQRVLLVALVMRGLGNLLQTQLAVTAHEGASSVGVICDGLFMTVISSDLVLAKMAGRELHPSIAVASAMFIVPHLPWLALSVAAFYYAAVFADLTSYLKLPLFGVCRNVYCDGIYDLCHIGHKNLFRRASMLGDRLFVGVVGDKDANEYKRPPVMSAAEREAEVAGCKGVARVIPEAPCFGLTEDFLRRHRIHVVAYGQEYLDRFPDPEDDPYYKVPRKLGIARPMPRTECFSTSELLSRIQKIEAADLAKKSPT